MGHHRSKKKKVKRVVKKAANTTAKAVEVAAPIVVKAVLDKIAKKL